ncbi:hypothetical protein CPB86DRAFT_779760 [Serendipita vermifera]|nr:hypothetical protein CPB86DRAFT_779760 [Serendipita vermifera]
MTIQDAVDGMTMIMDIVNEETDIPRVQRKARLRNNIESYFKSKNIPIDIKVQATGASDHCPTLAIIAHQASQNPTSIVRTYQTLDARPEERAVTDVIIAMCMPAEETPRATTPRYSTPAQTLISEARELFSSEAYVASIINLGCINVNLLTPSHATPTSDPEPIASVINSKLETSSIYYRFAPTIQAEAQYLGRPNVLRTRTVIYLTNPAVARKLEECVDGFTSRLGTLSLDQLTEILERRTVCKGLPMLPLLFVERPEPWERLKSALFGNTAIPKEHSRIVAVTGPIGRGKTFLVQKLVKENLSRYDYVFFVNSHTEASIQSELLEHFCSVRPESPDATMQDFVEYFCDARHGKWLFVFDRLDDPEVNISPFLLPCSHGSVILISSSDTFGKLATHPILHVRVSAMKESESIELLLRTAHLPTNSTNRHFAGIIAGELAHLPVAIQQAGDYISEHKITLETYVHFFRNQREKIMQPVGVQESPQQGIAEATLEISYQRFPPYLQDALHIFSFFHHTGFPLLVITLGSQRRFEWDSQPMLNLSEEDLGAEKTLQDIFWREETDKGSPLHGIIASLEKYSLVTIGPGHETQLLQFPRLSHSWAYKRIPPSNKKKIQNAALRLLSWACSIPDAHFRRYLVPHIEAILEHVDPIQIGLNDRIFIARFLCQSGQLDESKQLWVTIQEELYRRFGQSLLTAKATMQMAEAYEGNPKEQERLYMEALRINERFLGDQDEGTIASLNGLTMTHLLLGKLERAEESQRRILDITKKRNGEKHMETYKAKWRLAWINFLLGRLSEAEKLQVVVVNGMIDRIGKKEDPFTLSSNSPEAASFNLDPPMRPQRHIEFQPISKDELKERFEAQTLNLDALKIDLASIYYCQGRYWLAEAIQYKLLQTSKENADVDTACIMHDLAQTYQMQGRLQQAKEMALEAGHLKKSLLGSDHPSSRHTEALLKRIQNSINSSRHIRGRVSTMLEEASWMVWR